MYVTKHIDWLSFTVQTTTHPSVIFPLLKWRYGGKGSHGYQSRYTCAKTGMECQTDSSNGEMGTNFQLSGTTLEALRRELGGTDSGLCARASHLGGKASRIDLTINIHEGTLTPRAVRDAVRSGKAKPKANVSRFIEGKSGDVEGDTFYIGSPSSDRQFRAYNKAAELGVVNGPAWLRLELELRRVRANGAFQSVASNGVEATVTGHMDDFLDWGNVEYRTALQGPTVAPIDIPRRDTNRQRWLLGQVASALAKELIVDDEFANKFWASTLEELRKLKET